MRVDREGFGERGVVGEAGEVGKVHSSSVLWSLASVLFVHEDEDAEDPLLLRGQGCRATATAATSAVVNASPPLSALIRFFAFLRSRFLSLGVGSGPSSAV
jgi:hypothetical protein